MAPTDTPPHKAFGITNIKTYVPLLLDLDQLNYDQWRELFSTHCIGFDVIDHIDDSNPKPTTDEWKKVDSIVKLWIYGSISQNLLQMVLKNGSTALQVWNNLEKLFRDNKDAKTMQLDSELRNLVMGDLSVHAYFAKIKGIADLLANLDPDSAVPDKHLVNYAINGLSSKFESVANIIRYRSPLPSFLEVRSMILMEEQRLSNHRSTTVTSHVDHSSSSTVLNANTHRNQGQGRRGDRRQQQHRRRPPSSPAQPRYGWVYIPPPTSSRNTSHRGHQNPSPPWSAQQPGLLGPSPAAAYSPNGPHGQRPPAALFSATSDNPAWVTPDQATSLPELFSSMTLQDPGTTNWYMDTGATDHVHADSGILHSVLGTHDSRSIQVGNGSLMPVMQTGHAPFPLTNPYRPLHLHNILISPNIIKNLISVRQFTRQNKVSIEFDGFGFTVKDYETRRPLIRCDSEGPLYPVQSTTPQVLLSASRSTWHQRLGHPNDQVLQSLVQNNVISCYSNKSSSLCNSCQLGKHIHLPFLNSSSIVSRAFEIVHSDVWTSPISSISGLRYYVIFLDHYTHYLWVYPLKRKSDVFAKFHEFFHFVKNQFHTTIKSFQCDNGGEYNNHTFHDFFASHGIQFRFSCPHTSQQNGKSERMLRTINNTVRTLLFHAHLPPTYWVEALHMATHLLNILPSTTINLDTPHHRLFQKHPSYSHLRIFGCLCYPHLVTPHKLAPRSSPCVFLGYPSLHRGFRCLDLSTKRIIISRHVTFDESIFPFGSVTPDDPPSYSFLDDTSEPSPIMRDILQPSSSNSPVEPSEISPGSPNPASQTEPSPSPTEPHQPPPPPPSITSHPMTTRAKSGIHKPTQRLNLHTASLTPLPRSHLQALQDPHWRKAMHEEYHALLKNGTWNLVPRPPGVNVVRSMWLFRHKFNADGSLSRYKARLVANGRSQQPGIDCDETFSPVVKPATIRIILSIAVSQHWPIHQLDVKNAFLHGHLQETVYMHQPPGFRDPNYPDHVCHLQRSLYGLKQAPRAWYHRFTQYALRLGFQHSRSDTSLFIYRSDHAVAYLLLYVDDIILTASSSDCLRRIITLLGREFAMTDLGSLNFFLGISATRSPKGLFLSQQQYATQILERASMLSCKPARTPVETGHKLSADGNPVRDPSLYRSLAGALQYLTFTRPDIAFAVQQICLYMHDPREPHLQALKRILRYLRGTVTHGLQIHVSPSMHLTAYSDADWGGCPASRRSTSGYCVYLGDNIISWSSKRQGVVSRSSAEAEYRGVANTIAETSWIRNLLRELHRAPTKATVVYCDNVSAIYMSSNPVQHQRTKHIEIDIHFVRDKVALGHVRVLHVPSSSQYADIFTKGLPHSLFSDFKSSLNIRQSDVQTAGGC
ncbi:hypothetical protein OSB04_018893 [Centaurea solstitialis]|uniref:Integrase catalytic domain-containing protein n=1 Tax=Centaurea solstitialis TaxID=347529 RepID=A0AA38WBV2_9ASTR|nr:hypothetical protein OSB04_018893 [Centaurea solstitialis]